MICDLAETYHIYDYKAYPMEYIATLCCGLSSNSRIIKKINNQEYNLEDLMLINIVDKLSLIWWSKTADGQHNRNRPKLIAEILNGNKESVKQMSFKNADDFEMKRRQIIEEKKNGRRS